LATLRQDDRRARWGGEEFLVGRPGADRPAALRTAQRLREAVAAVRVASVPALRPAASIGWAIWAPPQALDPVIAAADMALYRAKAAGRDRIEPAT
ncbi:MAG: diguanylate cyclase, partial [Burkholderiales bacterium]|nr:diguanylate cyclase [Burkholderiales bacterium]